MTPSYVNDVTRMLLQIRNSPKKMFLLPHVHMYQCVPGRTLLYTIYVHVRR